MLDQSADFITALTAPVRHVRHAARVLSRTGVEILDGLRLEDGEITCDWTERKTGVVKRGVFTLSDPDGSLAPVIADGSDNPLWFDKMFHFRWGLKLPDGTIEYCPAARHWINDFRIRKGSVTISTVDRSWKHVGTHGLKAPLSVARGTTYADAIHDLLNWRGIDDESFDITSTKEFKRAQHFGTGMSPWLILQEWADDLDKQLFYRENGDVQLRSYPGIGDVAWAFNKNAEESIVMDWPDEGLSEAEVAQNVIVFTDRWVDDGPQAADRPEPVIGFAEIDPDSPLGAETISGNNKPTQFITDRPGVRTFAEADGVAEDIRDRQLDGLHAEREIRCLPLPHLEPMDVISTQIESALHRFRFKRFTWNVMPEGEMVINHSRDRKPWVKRHGGRR